MNTTRKADGTLNKIGNSLIVALILAMVGIFSVMPGSIYAILLQEDPFPLEGFHLFMGLLFFVSLFLTIVVFFYLSEIKSTKAIINSLLVIWGWYFLPAIAHWLGVLFEFEYLIENQNLSLLVPFVGFIIYVALSYAITYFKLNN